MISSYYCESRPEMLSLLPASAKIILDVGCGAGMFSKTLRENFSDLYIVGIEPNRDACNLARQHLDKVYNATFDHSIDFGNLKFDAIFFNDVLEHMVNPEEALNLARSLLNDGGVVISSIPNIRYCKVLYELIICKEFTYKDAGVLDKTHLRFFTESSIKNLYARSGFEVLQHKGINKTKNRMIKMLASLAPALCRDVVFLQFATLARPVPQTSKSD